MKQHEELSEKRLISLGRQAGEYQEAGIKMLFGAVVERAALLVGHLQEAFLSLLSFPAART